MKICVTGHRGFIASHLVQTLTQHDLSVWEWGDPQLDIRGLDWVIHIGAISSTTERDVEKIMRQNLDFSCWLLDQCIRYGVNLQFSSSASIYGQGRDFRESAPPDPRTPYAWSKYLFERHALSRLPEANEQGIRVQGFRYFNVYGTGEAHKGSQASPFTQFAAQARDKGCITVFEGSDKAWRDFVPVSTVCDMHQRFLAVDSSGIFNIGTGTVQSFLQVAQSFGVPIHTRPMPQELWHSYQWYTCADMTKTHQALISIPSGPT